MGYRIKTKTASMRVRKEPEKVENRTCGQCSRGTWNAENRDYTGAPFMIYCEHGTQGYSKRVRSFVTYKDCSACEHYKQGQREGGVL